jgi:lipoic acid synthetase
VAEAAARLRWRHVVVTSVTRDDLPDGGASHLAATVGRLRVAAPGASVELLVPDFGGAAAPLLRVLESRPDVVAHNVETVPRLYPRVRPQAEYGRSLALLARCAGRGGDGEGAEVKSGIMAGLGETREELRRVLADLREAGVSRLTVGQYLAPSPRHLPVARYLSPEEFGEIGAEASALGFRRVDSAPLVRSSYRAGAGAAPPPGGRST